MLHIPSTSSQQADSLGPLHSVPREPIGGGIADRPPMPGLGEEGRVGISVGRAETPAMRARATEKKVEGFIVIVVRCS